MLFVIRMPRIGWRVQAKRGWASSPNESAILRPSANGIIWKHSLEKTVRVGLRFGARLALSSFPISVSELAAMCAIHHDRTRTVGGNLANFFLKEVSTDMPRAIDMSSEKFVLLTNVNNQRKLFEPCQFTRRNLVDPASRVIVLD